MHCDGKLRAQLGEALKENIHLRKKLREWNLKKECQKKVQNFRKFSDPLWYRVAKLWWWKRPCVGETERSRGGGRQSGVNPREGTDHLVASGSVRLNHLWRVVTGAVPKCFPHDEWGEFLHFVQYGAGTKNRISKTRSKTRLENNGKIPTPLMRGNAWTPFSTFFTNNPFYHLWPFSTFCVQGVFISFRSGLFSALKTSALQCPMTTMREQLNMHSCRVLISSTKQISSALRAFWTFLLKIQLSLPQKN